ncbi:MAG: hypothetical protein GY941_29370 [Planctomycetes bacterium]|nr:hypothetical protein [Planctomycetota bacterium]
MIKKIRTDGWKSYEKVAKYREIKNQGVVYSVEIGESRSGFVDFFGIILGGVEREA